MAATGYTLASFTPFDAHIPGGGVGITQRGSVPVLTFQKGLRQAVEFAGVIPRPAAVYSGFSGILVKILCSAAQQQTTGNILWGAELHPVSATDKQDPTLDTGFVPGSYEVTGAATVNSTGGGATYISITLPNTNLQGAGATAPAAGDFFRLRIRRIGDNASDTMLGDALLHSVELVDN